MGHDLQQQAISAAASWLAEAVETGSPLAALPTEVTPQTPEEGEDLAGEVLEVLGLIPIGIRLSPGPDGALLAGPMLEGRLLPAGAAIALATLRHPVATAAVIGVLAEALLSDGDGLPKFSALHPAIDIGASRFTKAPATAALAAADLGGLGLVVAGRPGLPALPDAVPVTLALAGKRPRPVDSDVASALAAAAQAARRLGGLPAGAVLVVAGLGPVALVPESGMVLAASLGPIGKVKAAIV
jgi:hypothetical protein